MVNEFPGEEEYAEEGQAGWLAGCLIASPPIDNCGAAPPPQPRRQFSNKMRGEEIPPINAVSRRREIRWNVGNQWF